MSQNLHPYYTALCQVATENQQNFKELLKWSRSHQQHQYRLLKDILEEQQEKLREAAAADCGEVEDTETSSNLLADLVSWNETTSASIPDVPGDVKEVSDQLTVGEVLQQVSPERSRVDDESGEVDDSSEWQGFQAARSSSLEALLKASNAIGEAQQEASKDEEGCMTGEDSFDPLLAHILDREPSPPPALEPEDRNDELDNEFKKLTDNLATLQLSSRGQTDSDLLATLSQGDVILPSDLLDLDPTDLSSLDFTPCLTPGMKEETHSEAPDSGEETSRESKVCHVC